MDSIYCHFGNLCNCAHYDRTDKRKEGKKMKAEFKGGYWTACYGGSVLYEKSTLQRMTKADLIELIECAQHNYEVLLDERDHFQDMILSIEQGTGGRKMKYRIIYRRYGYPNADSLLEENLERIEAQAFEIKNGFVSIWTKHNETQTPNVIINANDVLTIYPIEEEE